MKKSVAVILALFLLLCGCSSAQNISSVPAPSEEPQSLENTASSGVWLSFSEINSMLDSTDGFKKEFEKVVENCKGLKIENLYVHVRAYCDSLFPSEYFPLISRAEKYDFDIFEYIVDTCRQNGIRVHAWINPYRVLTSSTEITALDKDSPAYKWLSDDKSENDVNVVKANGIYLNPAEYEVRELVINGIREILENYEVAGIHFDDYFYPTTDDSFDAESYAKYKSETENPLALDEWRRANVNALISGCYTAVKFYDKDILFTVSPAASIENNYNSLYADVKSWVESGCVDYIIPQLYFGFEYPNPAFSFENLLNEWEALVECNDDVGLLIGLASYKIGTDAESDKAEWQSDDDIIARQVENCYESDRVAGYVLFSYSSLFGEQELNTRQRENLAEYIEKCEQ